MSFSKTAFDSCSHFIAEETEARGMMGLTPGLKPKLKIVNQLYMHTKILEFCYFYSHASTAAKYHSEFLELSFLTERCGVLRIRLYYITQRRQNVMNVAASRASRISSPW